MRSKILKLVPFIQKRAPIITRDHLILGLFLALPFAFLSSGMVHKGHLFGFILAALIIITLQMRNVFLKGFFLYAFIWTIYLLINNVPVLKFSEGTKHAFLFMVSSTFALIIYVAIARSTLKIETFYNIICIAAIIQSFLALGQLIEIDLVFNLLAKVVNIERKLLFYSPVGTLGNPNFLGAFIAISLPFFFRKYWRCFIPLLLHILFFTTSSSAIIPAIVGTLVLLGKKYLWIKPKWTIITAILILCYLIYDSGTILRQTGRFEFWLEGIRQLNSVPKVIFGFGPGASWGRKFPFHNEWLTILYQFGAIGFVMIVGYVVTIYRDNRMLFASFIIICINMLGNYPLHLVPSVFLILIIIGLIERERYVCSNS